MRFVICNIFCQKVVRNAHKNILKITVSTGTQLYHLSNRSYSIIQPLIYPTYILKISEWLSLWDFFYTLTQKWIRTAQQNSHQFEKKINIPHVIRSSSPVTNPSGKLTKINVT